MLATLRRSRVPVHGDSSGRSLDSPKSQCSIGFQPVFFRANERRFAGEAVLATDN